MSIIKLLNCKFRYCILAHQQLASCTPYVLGNAHSPHKPWRDLGHMKLVQLTQGNWRIYLATLHNIQTPFSLKLSLNGMLYLQLLYHVIAIIRLRINYISICFSTLGCTHLCISVNSAILYIHA
jgi:hypothetical protein